MTASRDHASRGKAGCVVALAILSAALASPAFAEDRTDALFPASQDQMCFARQYDAAHLKRTPEQQVTRILASVVRNRPPAGGVTLRVRVQSRAADRLVDVAAGCEWSDRGGIDGAGKPLLPTYRKKDGFACIALFSNASAEEAGAVLFDIPDGGKTTTLHFDHRIGAWADASPHPKRKYLALGKDDRVFRLDRVADADCASLISQVRVD